MTSPADRLVLVVDDEAAVREVLAMRLGAWGYDVCTAADGEEALRLAGSRHPRIVLSDVVLPDTSGVDLLAGYRASSSPPPAVVMMTAYGSIDVAVEAMKNGARDFLTKPLDYGKLRSVLDRVEGDEPPEEVTRIVPGSETPSGSRDRSMTAAAEGLSSRSPRMRELLELVEKLASSDASALITGESGAGKEVFARTIHRLSRRRTGPFVAVNTAALPEGLVESELFGHERGAFTGAAGVRRGCFELAHGGTLFLDEISEMPISLQPKLLRVLEEGTLRRLGGAREIPFDVRVLAATNRAPEDAVQEGRLREDLFYRLNVFHLSIPPLRARSEDVELLTESFVEQANARHGLAVEGVEPEALAILERYGWPGNVRELRNVTERACILAGKGAIAPEHLPPHLEEGGSRPMEISSERVVLPVGITAADAEKQLILATLERTGQNKAEAARLLGLNVKTIRNKLKQYGLDTDDD
jgi:DNA-binding NtrC family response regulator